MSARRVRCAIAAAAVLPIAVLAGDPGGAQAPPPLEMDAAQPSVASRVTADKAPTSRLAETDPALLARDDAEPVAVMIKLDYDSVATYQGGVDDLAATSPSVTGTELTGDSAAEVAYDAHVADVEQAIVAEVAAAVPEIQMGQSLRVVYGGVAAVLPANRVEDVLAVDGVVAVQEDALRQPLTDSSPEFLGAPTLYDEFGTTANAGQGVIYGNLDTGIWPEHSSFADQGNLSAPPGPARECDYGDNPLTLDVVDVFVCNDKLIGGAAFLDTYLSNPARAAAEPYHTARDSNGHGTHTASTSAGNVLDSAPVLGVERGPIHGLAPGAWVMEYKVCGIEGCFGSDSARAVQQAITDGVDVINFSISGGTDPFTDPVELAFLDAYAAGVFVSASAGNSGPGAGTANHLSPWVTTVGASTQTREFATTLTLNADNGETFTTDGASITAGAGPLPVVLASAAPYSSARCLVPAPPGLFTGKIVACERGTNARVDKGYNVLQGGAAGMILYNAVLQDVETDTHWLPTVHLPVGTDFLAFMGSHTGVVGSFPAGEKRDGQGDVMAAFSSRGPGGNFIKPDITAPGVQILAGDTPIVESTTSGPGGEYFQAIAGTSMSSPHIAGSAILLAALHPDWTPGQIKSAIMTTATTDVVKEDLVTPADPLDMGAGRVDLSQAGYASLTFDETPANFFAMGNNPLTAVHLNLPSVNAPVMPGRLTTTRVATNVSGLRQRFTTSAESDHGSITVLPRRFTLDPGESVTISITIEATHTGAQQFGTVHITSNRGNPLHLPVAFVPTQGTVNLSQSCSPLTIPRRGTSTCEVVARNDAFEGTFVDLRTTVNHRLRITGTEGAALIDNRTAELNNVWLSGAEPGVPAVDPGESPGYFSLAALGVPAEPIGDEEIINYTVPAFQFAGQTWNTVGVVSNGYVVVGGGAAEDINCCNLPTGPSPAPPNNMLAPFWTDLDGTGAPGIFAAVLTDGVNDWLVFEYQLNVYGTADRRTFQTWIGVGGPEDITYAYAAPQGDPAGQPFLMGAENQAGEGDMVAVLPAVDQRVTSTAFTPGGSVSYKVFVRGVQSGTGRVTTSMNADIVPGTTIISTDIRILK